MQNPLSRYITLIKRWAWVVMLGMVICCGATFLASKLTHPTYQASAILVIDLDASSPGNTTASLAAVPTYAQLLTNHTVLEPVAALHRGMTVQQLSEAVTVKPQSNTQLIELDVQNSDPQLAAQLANEISKSFALYADAQLPGSVQILQAQRPLSPIKPQPLQDTGIAALVSFGLAIALIIIFEWVGDQIADPDEIPTLLGMELLTVIPQFLQKKRHKISDEVLAEKYYKLCASLNATQAIQSFKLVMVTSALAGEGKSTVVASLASFLAMTGKKVLLVDANLHHPVLSQRFHLDDQQGLSTTFADMLNMSPREFSAQETTIPNLHLLTAGKAPVRPAELLQSSLAASFFSFLKNAPFDYVIFDAPAMLPVADVQIMASLVHAVILVCDISKTPRRVLLRVKHELNNVHALVLGLAINKSRWSDYVDKPQHPKVKEQSQVDSVFLSTSLSATAVVPISTSSRGPHPLKLPSIPMDRIDNPVSGSHQQYSEASKLDSNGHRQ